MQTHIMFILTQFLSPIRLNFLIPLRYIANILFKVLTLSALNNFLLRPEKSRNLA